MPELRGTDVPKRDPAEMNHDPRHDALLSNPELREAYSRLEEEGHSTGEAHYLARKEVFGEDWEPDVPEYYEDVDIAKSDDFDYEAVDDALFEAHEKCVQWKAHEENPDLSKSPGIWTSRDQVPDYVQEVLEEILEQGDVIWSDYAHLPPGAQAAIQEELTEAMTQPQGWSLGSIVDRMEDRFPEDVARGYLTEIARNETGVVLNRARERAYEDAERPDEEFVYDWVGPTDHRTTPLCEEMENWIEANGGAVPLPDLKDKLEELARKYANDPAAGGTPDRARDFSPHYNCRRTFVRRVQAF